MKLKTGLVSLLVVCGACSQAPQEVDVVKDSFDFAAQQFEIRIYAGRFSQGRYVGRAVEKEPCFSPHDRR